MLIILLTLNSLASKKIKTALFISCVEEEFSFAHPILVKLTVFTMLSFANIVLCFVNCSQITQQQQHHLPVGSRLHRVWGD